MAQMAQGGLGRPVPQQSQDDLSICASKVHTSSQEVVTLVDMVNGSVCISAKSALNWPDNAPICCSHSNAMVSYKGGERACSSGGGECCCAQHDARHALHDHNLQHTLDFSARSEIADILGLDTSIVVW